MKKALVVLLLLIIICFIPVTQQFSINIKASYYDVCRQLVSPDNWKNWQSDIKSKIYQPGFSISKDSTSFVINIPGQTFNVQHRSANLLSVVHTVHHLDYDYGYEVIPGVLNNTKTATVVVDSKTNVFKWLLLKTGLLAPQDPILELKRFMEDVNLYYGFNIINNKVTESHLVVLRKTVLTANKYATISNITGDINKYIISTNLKPVKLIDIEFFDQKPDSVQIMVGIPVSKQVPSTVGFAYMHMPASSMITGYYQGKYGDRKKLYNAMGKYLLDHVLQPQVAPFETFTNNKLPQSDSDLVDMQINYPVL